MSKSEPKTYMDFVLPPSVVSRVDVSRLASELERVDNELTTAKVRTKAGSSERANPAMSDRLTEFLAQNKLSLDDDHGRSELVRQVRLLKDKVPIIHMTFAVEADQESLGHLVKWLRESIHPQAVISVGLQPALVAGVYLRTPNHVHDLSLRAKIQASRNQLAKELEALRG